MTPSDESHPLEVGKGTIRRAPLGKRVRVGNRAVPNRIEFEIPADGGNPSVFMLIETVLGVPRCTELTFRRSEGGREIRGRDLRAVNLDDWVEHIVSRGSGVIEERPDGGIKITHSLSDEDLQAGIRVIQDIRKGSRRAPTQGELENVAAIYNAAPQGGLNRLLAAGYTPSTAKRRVRDAKAKGLIPAKEQD